MESYSVGFINMGNPVKATLLDREKYTEPQINEAMFFLERKLEGLYPDIFGKEYRLFATREKHYRFKIEDA